MNATVIHPPTGHGAHAGAPAGDPQVNIQAIRTAVRDTAVLERDLDLLRDALKARDALCARLGLQLVRAEEAATDLVDQAWRLEQENRRLSAENRVLRDRLERLLSRRGSRRARHRRDRP